MVNDTKAQRLNKFDSKTVFLCVQFGNLSNFMFLLPYQPLINFFLC